MKIRLLGKEAQYFADVFTEYDARIITSHEEVAPDVDFVFCLSYSLMIPDTWLGVPRVGFFVNHSSDLPRGRGWAPLQWSVLKGLKHVTVTFFRAGSGADTGDWCYKERYPILRSDLLEDLYAKDRTVTRALLLRAVEDHLSGALQYHPQIGEHEYWRRRTPADSQVDGDTSLPAVWDSLRICDPVHYPAFFQAGNDAVAVRCSVEREASSASELDALRRETLRSVWERSTGQAFRFHVDGRPFALRFGTL